MSFKYIPAASKLHDAQKVSAALEGCEKALVGIGGKRIDGGADSTNPVSQAVRALETPAPVSVGGTSAGGMQPAKSAGDSKPSLFSRLGNKLKSLVTKPPRSQH